MNEIHSVNREDRELDCIWGEVCAHSVCPVRQSDTENGGGWCEEKGIISCTKDGDVWRCRFLKIRNAYAYRFFARVATVLWGLLIPCTAFVWPVWSTLLLGVATLTCYDLQKWLGTK